MIKLKCSKKKCIAHQKDYEFLQLEKCPICQSNTNLVFDKNEENLKEHINKLPVQIARPLYDLECTDSYFKKINLISDVLLGAMRTTGGLVISLAKQKGKLSDELNESVQTLIEKESHGLWSSLISKILENLDEEKDVEVVTPLMKLYGVKSKTGRRVKNKTLKIENEYIDAFGKKQKVVIENNALELLINFRNKYLGHGNAYSEEESKKLFETYSPIFKSFLEQCAFIQEIEWLNKKGESIIGYHASASDTITAIINDSQYEITIGNKLALDQPHLIKTGAYKCINKSCGVSKKKIGFPAEQECPECKTLLVLDEKQLFDKADHEIINTYPYFIAHPYYRAISETEPYKKLHLLKECFLNYLKYLGLITASEYFNSDLKIKSINRNFKDLIYRPQFGYWNKFLRETIASLEENKHNWFIPELPVYYKKIEAKASAKSPSKIGQLINFRNHYLGHGSVPSNDKSKELWSTNFKLLKDLLKQLDFCKNYTIISASEAKNSKQAYRLMGNEITNINLRDKLRSNVVLFKKNNEQISLAPFFILPGKHFIKEVAENARLMVYEQNTGKRIVFFSPESITGETSGTVLKDLNVMVNEKEKEKPVSTSQLTRKRLKERLQENNNDFYHELVGERKVIPGVYQERQDAEISLRSWIGALASIYFLTAEAGSGKTNLLVEMSRQYNERGIDTLFLRGNRFQSSDFWKELCYRLNLSDKFDIDKSKAFKYTQENPLMILIDGCNEHPEQEKVFESILKFLSQHKGGHIKVVVSWRVNTKSELPNIKKKYESIIYSDSTDQITEEENYIAKACYWLKPLNKKEVEGCWEKYTKDKKSKVKRIPNFSYEDLTYHDRSLSDQLDNPLLMRLFLEMFNGKGLPKSDGGFINIWSLYHNKLIAQ